MMPALRRRLVSVVIPTYNRADLLRECLDSVRAQTYRPLELIVADDGSTDQTEETVAAFREQACQGSGLEVIHLPLPRGGAPKARNAGVARATGEFIQYVDSDDLLHPRKIELHVAAFTEHPDAEFVWGLYSYFDEAVPANNEYQTDAVQREIRGFVAQRWKEIPGMVHIGMFRQAACARIGPWNETLARWQDVEYMMRFARLQPKVARQNAVLYYLRRHSGGQIKDLYQKTEGVRAGLHSLEVIERGFPVIPSPDADMQRAMSNFYKSVAETALQNGLTVEFEAAMRGAARHRPGVPFKTRVLGIRLVRLCCGPAWALKLLRGYHAARLPVVPECVD
jgi:glycosyltransferase involved in cell wall biosynthesis